MKAIREWFRRQFGRPTPVPRPAAGPPPKSPQTPGYEVKGP